ncbi:MAG: class I SAM-dependent methyltransferase [Agarilytica sp.]
MLTIDFKHIDWKNGDRILDMGCGEGRHSIGAAYHYPQVCVVALDLDFDDLSTAKQRHRDFDKASFNHCLYLQGNGYTLPFPDNCFDHIICSEVLEHVPNYSAILHELHRVLKPGGSLSVSVPRFWPEKICWALSTAYHQVEGGHIRIFKSKELRHAIQKLDFSFRHQHWAHALHVPYWWLRCAFWKQGENFALSRWYHKLLVWDMLKRPWLTQTLDTLLNPIIGKSVVMYFDKSKTDTNPTQP